VVDTGAETGAEAGDGVISSADAVQQINAIAAQQAGYVYLFIWFFV
jgi:hypothetical protein